MKKKLFLSVIVLGLIGACIGYYLFQKPVQSLKNAKADFQVEAVKLLASYEEDEVRANEKYLDKIIEVNGVVQKIEEKNGRHTYYLETESMMSNVICELEKGSKSVAKVGDQLKLKGLCSGYLMDVVLVRSVIIN